MQIKDHAISFVTMSRVIILKDRVILYPAYDQVWLLPQRIEIKLDHDLSKALVRK